MENKTKNNIVKTLFIKQVPSECVGKRVDAWLAENTDLSRSRIASLIKQGYVFLKQDRLVDISKKVKQGDVFQIDIPEPVAPIPKAQEIPLDIVFEDEDLLVLNKSAGLVVHPACGHAQETLVNALLAHCGESLSGIGGVARPGIVHRLDKDTSGLMVVAKNDKTHQGLSEQFAVHSLTRCYQALVWSMPKNLSGIVEGQMGRSRFNRQKMAVLQSGGKYAKTIYATKEVFCGGLFSLLECSLKTGRTHQVRVHMTSLGHPLLGDVLYGKTPKNAKDLPDFIKNFPRQALHSYKMAFIHPKTNREMFFEIPLPADMQRIVDWGIKNS